MPIEQCICFITYVHFILYVLYKLYISRTLRSSVSKQLFVRKTKLNIGKCTFSVAASTIWNHHPIAIKSSETIDTFHKKWKLFVWNCFSAINFQLNHSSFHINFQNMYAEMVSNTVCFSILCKPPISVTADMSKTNKCVTYTLL